MKITYISASILPSTNASSVHVMKMCNALSKNGNEVILVGTQGRKEVTDIYSYYGVENEFTLKLAKKNKLSSINRLLYGIKCSYKADIVYTRWIIAAIALIIVTNKKIIYEHHAPPHAKLYKSLEARIIKSKKVKRHIFITSALKEYYKKYYPNINNKDSLVLADGADLNKKINNEQKEENIDCIYIGSFQKGKGINTVIKLANKLPHITFGIVGGNEQEVKEYKSLVVSENVKWYGYLAHEKTYSILSKAKIALLPNEPKVIIESSKQDIGSWTSPMKLFEYMAAKKAIVASDLDVLKEVLIHDKNSLLVQYNDLEDWERAVKKLLNNKELRENISLNAYNDLKEKYTWKSRAEQSLKNLIHR